MKKCVGMAPRSVRIAIAPGKRPPHTDKTTVLSLINRETGEVRSRIIPDVTGTTLGKALGEQVNVAGSHLHTDSWVGYGPIGQQFISHESVNHKAGEYVRGTVTTNHAEGFFSQLKWSIDGTHHHVSVEHLPRHLAEFDFPLLHPEDERHRSHVPDDGSGWRAMVDLPTASHETEVQ